MRLALAGRIFFVGVGDRWGLWGFGAGCSGTMGMWGSLPNWQILFQNGVAVMKAGSSLPGR